MSFLLQPLHICFAVLAEYVRKQQELVIEYQLENQVLREQIGGKRVLLDDDQRRLLAVKGKRLRRSQLAKIATIAQADTILRWHRELIDPNGGARPRDNRVGRPPVDQEVVELVLRMARENESWGYKRIEGALHNLGYSICSSTVANILKRYGVEPAPSRKRTTSWSTFFKTHRDVLEGIELSAITLWLSGLARVLFVSRSSDPPIPLDTVPRSDDDEVEASRGTMVAVDIRDFTDAATTLPARPPPIPSVPLPFIVSRKVLRAA